MFIIKINNKQLIININMYERNVKNVIPDKKINITPVVREDTEIYEIKLNTKSKFNPLWKLTYSSLFDEQRILNSMYTTPEFVKKLWDQKERLDEYFDPSADISKIYYTARNSIFPQDQKGSQRFRNRAGDKLFEVHEAVGLFPLKGGIFFDICGGPGAWSEVLLKGGNWIGYGMTLHLDNSRKNEIWYNHLYKDKKWIDLWGSDNTGNIYKLKNINHVSGIIKTNHVEGVTVAMGDGGIHISKDEQGKNMENLQELYNARIIIGELLVGLKTLKKGGYFCCKLFDTFSHLSASIVYVIGLLFNKVYIVKPRKSRIVNSERYVVGHKFMDINSLNLIKHIENIFDDWENPKGVPISIVPINLMQEDKIFMKTFGIQVTELCDKQTKALKQVMDLADTYKK